MRTFENWADWSTLVSTRNLEQNSAAEQRPRSTSRLRMFLERRGSGANTLVSTRNLEQDSAAQQRPRSTSRLRMFLERRASGSKCVRLLALCSGPPRPH